MVQPQDQATRETPPIISAKQMSSKYAYAEAEEYEKADKRVVKEKSLDVEVAGIHGHYGTGKLPHGKYSIPRAAIERAAKTGSHRKLSNIFGEIPKHLIPESGDESGFISKGLTNVFVRERNYTHFLDPKNSKKTMQDLGNLLLIKLGDIDRERTDHLFKYLEDNKDWMENDADLVLNEMQDAIKQLEDKETPNLSLILKLIRETEAMAEKEADFQAKRTGNLSRKLEQLAIDKKFETLRIDESEAEESGLNLDNLFNNLKMASSLPYVELPPEGISEVTTLQGARSQGTLYNEYLLSDEYKKRLDDSILGKDGTSGISQEVITMHKEADTKVSLREFLIRERSSNQHIDDELNNVLSRQPYSRHEFSAYLLSESKKDITSSKNKNELESIKNKYGSSYDNMVLSDYVQKQILASQHNGEKRTPQSLLYLNALLSENRIDGLSSQRMKDIKENLSTYENLSDDFPILHDDSMKIASDSARRLIGRTKEPPVILLAALSLSDEDLQDVLAKNIFSDNIASSIEERIRENTRSKQLNGEIKTPITDKVAEEIKDEATREVHDELDSFKRDVVSVKREVEEVMSSEIIRASREKGVLVTQEQANQVLAQTKKNLNSNITQLLSVFSKKDDLQKQEQYNPYNFTKDDKNNDIALNAIRDALYLATAKELDSTLYEKVFDKEQEDALILASLDKSILKERPDTDKVNDLHNAVQLLTDANNAKIDEETIELLTSSSIFLENRFVKPNERESLKGLAKDLSLRSETEKEHDIFGLGHGYDEQEIERLIQDRNYTQYAEKITRKLSVTNLAAYALQNNKILHNFSSCMENSKSPTNHVETSPSLAKGCFDKLLDETKDASQKMEELSTAAALGFNPFAIFVFLHQASRKAEEIRIKYMMEDLQAKIREDTNYVQDAELTKQSVSRIMLSEIKDMGDGGIFVKEGFAQSLISEAEKEATVYDIIQGEVNIEYGIKLDSTLNGSTKLSEFLDAFNNDKELVEKRRLTSVLKSKIIPTQTLKEIEELKTELLKTDMNNLSEEDEDRIRRKLEEIEKTLEEDLENKGILEEEEMLLEKAEKNAEKRGKSEETSILLKDRLSNNGMDLKKLSYLEAIRLTEVLGSYREELFKEMAEKKMKDAPPSETIKLEKEAYRIQEIIPQLHKKILSSNELAAELTKEEFKQKYGIDLKHDVYKKIKEEGLSASKQDIFERHKDELTSKLNSTESKTLLGLLIATEEVQEVILAGGQKSPDNINSIASYLKRVESVDRDMAGVIHKSNNHHFTEGITANKKTYVYGAVGFEAHLAKEQELAIRRGDVARADKLETLSSANGITSSNAEYISKKHTTVAGANRDVGIEKMNQLKNTDKTRRVANRVKIANRIKRRAGTKVSSGPRI